MKSKDDKNLLEAYESVSKLQVEAESKIYQPKQNIAGGTSTSLKDLTYAKKAEYDEDLAEWIKTRISRELPQDLDVREDLVKLYKKLSANQLGKEITKPNDEKESQETLTRAQYAMSGYSGPNS
jgi:hypothetical protein